LEAPTDVAALVIEGERRFEMSKTIYRLERSQWIPTARHEVFDFFSDAGNLESITPPFLHFRILSRMPVEMRAGAYLEYSLALFGIRFRWRTRIPHWEHGVSFVDEQESGPYELWRHSHVFKDEEGGTVMSDTVEYALPLGILGRLAHWLFVRCTLDRIFDYRRDVIARWFGEARPGSTRVVFRQTSPRSALVGGS
jgi:ligand-binding SRPBCC domain-containing protein